MSIINIKRINKINVYKSKKTTFELFKDTITTSFFGFIKHHNKGGWYEKESHLLDDYYYPRSDDDLIEGHIRKNGKWWTKPRLVIIFKDDYETITFENETDMEYRLTEITSLNKDLLIIEE